MAQQRYQWSYVNSPIRNDGTQGSYDTFDGTEAEWHAKYAELTNAGRRISRYAKAPIDDPTQDAPTTPDPAPAPAPAPTPTTPMDPGGIPATVQNMSGDPALATFGAGAAGGAASNPAMAGLRRARRLY